MVWLLVAVLIGLLCWGGWSLLVRSFVGRYFSNSYKPIPLSQSEVGEFPPSFHLQNVPWFSTLESYCEANTLQMIAHQKGKMVSRDEVNFLMGFTYGASGMPSGGLFGPNKVGFSPFTDPEPGHAMAAPYLGLVRHYYVTRDPKLYLRALRFYLSRGYPLHVPLDYAVLYGLKDFFPHSNLLVGYDPTGFFYYETVGLPGVPFEPGIRAVGEQGLKVSEGKLLQAIESQARHFRFPWRYAFALFEAGPTQTDLWPVWVRNARLLMGGEKYGPKQGADAIEQTAAGIQQNWRRVNPEQWGWFLPAAVYTRHDNADFLRARFAGDERVPRAAGLFERAAQKYGLVQQAIEQSLASQSQADQIATWLCEGATYEREAGRIFNQIGNTLEGPPAPEQTSDAAQPAAPSSNPFKFSNHQGE